ncbi:MAG: MFS transporter, partial [Thermodesulfobacteriota bacterium]|nr:MFS transporter [Thermodesulfobacteriota bacterium]
YASGIFYYGFSTFVKPVSKELGWSMALVSGAFSLYRLEAGIAAPIVGFLLDRIGPRKLVFSGGIIMGGGLIYLSQVTNVLPFYAAIITISLGWSAFAGSAVGNPLIGKWFVKKRGQAIGIYAASRGLSGLLVPVVAYLIVLYGWRSALLIMGPLTCLIVLPLSFALKHSPEKYGLLPDGGRSGHDAHRTEKTAEVIEVDFPVRKAMQTPAFWIITLCLFTHQVTQSAIFVHLIPYLIDVGIDPKLAASVVMSVTLASTLGRYGFGWLSDSFNKKWLLFILYILQPIGVFSLVQVHHIMDVIPFVLIYSTAYGGNAVVKAAITGDYYGRKNFGTIYGFIQGISTLGSIAGPLIAGLVYDMKGSYSLAFTSFAIMMGFVALLVLFLKRPTLVK